MPKVRRVYESGQALLIVLLSMAVVLTIVLSVLSRSVSDIAVTSRGEESIRAFSAAEAGVEKALITAGSNFNEDFDSGAANFEAKVDQIGEGLKEFSYPVDISMGDTATVWFVAHDDQGNLVCDSNHTCFTGDSFSLCWGLNQAYPTAALRPAIEVSIYYLNTPGDPTSARIARIAYDANNARTPTNRFYNAATTGCSVDGKTYPFSAQILLGAVPNGLGIPASVIQNPNGLQLAIVRLLYNSDVAHPIGVSSGSVFPNQGKRIESTGTSGEAARRVRVFKLFSDIPAIFSSAVFAPVGITK